MSTRTTAGPPRIERPRWLGNFRLSCAAKYQDDLPFAIDFDALYFNTSCDRRAQCARHVFLAEGARAASHDSNSLAYPVAQAGCRDARCVGRERQSANAVKVRSETRAEVTR